MMTYIVQQVIKIPILPIIPRSKSNETMKFGQLIKNCMEIGIIGIYIGS